MILDFSDTHPKCGVCGCYLHGRLCCSTRRRAGMRALASLMYWASLDSCCRISWVSNGWERVSRHIVYDSRCDALGDSIAVGDLPPGLEWSS